MLLQVTTSLMTDKLQVVDSNGQILMEVSGSDTYVDTAEGRVWRLMYYFAAPYEGIIEVYPGNVSGWNEARANGTYVKVGETAPEPTAEPVAPSSEPVITSDQTADGDTSVAALYGKHLCQCYGADEL